MHEHALAQRSWHRLRLSRGCLDPGYIEPGSVQTQVARFEHCTGLPRRADVIESRRWPTGLVARGEYVACDEIGDAQ